MINQTNETKDESTLLFKILKKHGPISITTIRTLSKLEKEKIWGWIQSDTLPINPNKRPPCPISNHAKPSNGRISIMPYKKSMVEYFNLYINLYLDHPAIFYETLANYYDSKTLKSKI